MSKRRLFALGGLLLLAVVIHGGLYWFQHLFQQRDFSPIADLTSRVGYCMATSLAPNEKMDLAESAARPPDQALFAKVMSIALSGEVTQEKLAASRALLERDELKSRGSRALARVAEQCGYHDLRRTPESPHDLAMRWLQNDAGFLATLAQARQRQPDAAVRFAARLEEAARATHSTEAAADNAAPRAN